MSTSLNDFQTEKYCQESNGFQNTTHVHVATGATIIGTGMVVYLTPPLIAFFFQCQTELNGSKPVKTYAQGVTLLKISVLAGLVTTAATASIIKCG